MKLACVCICDDAWIYTYINVLGCNLKIFLKLVYGLKTWKVTALSTSVYFGSNLSI
jgi:hypothetical protein